jgi:hypothetical protein
MMHAPGVEAAREYYYQKNSERFLCGSRPSEAPQSLPVEPLAPVTNYRAGFGLGGLWGAGLNATQQFVGNYRVTIIPQQDGSAMFMLHNTTSMKSFLYGSAPSWERGAFGPGGNMRQVFFWTE